MICWQYFFVIFNITRVSFFFSFLLFLSSPLLFSCSLLLARLLTHSLVRSLALAVFIISGRIESIHLRIKSIMRGRESRLYLLYQGLSGERHFCYRNSTEYLIHVKQSLLSFSRNKKTTNFYSFSSPLFTV